MGWKKGNRLLLVNEAQAQGRTREVYDELKQSLGLPHVNVVFQVYGGYPAFLDVFWRVFKPAIKTKRFFDLGERLRADAYTRMHNYFEVPDLCSQMTDLKFSEGARNELTETVDLFLYNNPLLLLIEVALMQALEGPIGTTVEGTEEASHPVFTKRPVLVDENAAPIPVRKIYDEIKRTTGMPIVNSDYLAFARWPDFLREYWETVKRIYNSPIYQQSLSGIRETAWNLARELPGTLELSVSAMQEAGVGENEIGSVVRISEVFVSGLSGMTLNVAVAKIGLEGGNIQQKARLAAQNQLKQGVSAQPATTAPSKEPTRAA